MVAYILTGRQMYMLNKYNDPEINAILPTQSLHNTSKAEKPLRIDV